VPAALVIESDVILRNFVRSVLRSQGFEMLDAASAAEALTLCQLLREPAVDLLIVNYPLPGPEGALNSKALVEQILRFSPVLKVLVISDCPYRTVHEENGLPEGSWFLQKPFTAMQLIDMAKNILKPKIQ
jgi:DNA-binding response OmpR family regulator